MFPVETSILPLTKAEMLQMTSCASLLNGKPTTFDDGDWWPLFFRYQVNAQNDQLHDNC